MFMLDKKKKVERKMKFSFLIYLGSMIYSYMRLKKFTDKAMDALDVYVEKNK